MEWLDKQPDKERDVMLMTWFLGEPEIRELKTWNHLGTIFRNENRAVILKYCGFDTGRWPIERIRVDDPELFIAYMSAMSHYKILGDCTYEELADYIDLVFVTGYEVSTICNKLKAADDVFYDLCEAVKKRKKDNDNKRNA